jgi:NADH dehydrogenase [ubiquinone] 1 alpha subcomplex assembly factor 1
MFRKNAEAGFTISFADLKATSFGRIVEGAKPLDASNVEAVGFLMADKRAGPFKLEVAWIKGTPKAAK